jgi:hypothetical protein
LKKLQKTSLIESERENTHLEALHVKLLLLLDQKTGREKNILRKTILEIEKRIAHSTHYSKVYIKKTN